MRCAAREENYPLCPNARKSERETARERSPESPLVEDEEKTETKREEERKKIKREFEQRSAKINETRPRIIKKTSMLLKKKKKKYRTSRTRYIRRSVTKRETIKVKTRSVQGLETRKSTGWKGTTNKQSNKPTAVNVGRWKENKGGVKIKNQPWEGKKRVAFENSR